MKYAIDRIEKDIAICENLETKEIIEINTTVLPNNIKDGSIIILENNEYKLDLNEEEIRRKRIQERFNKLKKN